MRVEEEYADILHGIESAIVTVYENNPELVDRDVVAAIEALMRAYEREKRNREEILLVPPGRARSVFEQCRRVCERKLGRESFDEGIASPDDPDAEKLSVFELMRCLKRLRKSIRLWHKQGGRQGYLTYVRGFIAE